MTTDPNTHVDLLDKDGNIIGSGTTDDTGHVTITPTKPIPEGNVTAKATDNAEHPNSSTSQTKKARLNTSGETFCCWNTRWKRNERSC